MTNKYLHALDLIAKDDWHGAHQLIQHEHDKLSCLIHGYLHHQEGDIGNATYWYQQAGQTLPQSTLEDEMLRLYNLASIAK